MWRDYKKSVDKMFIERYINIIYFNKYPNPTTYPQNYSKQYCKTWPINNIKQAVHLSTPLIVLINFYI